MMLKCGYRPLPEDVARLCRFQIRRQQFVFLHYLTTFLLFNHRYSEICHRGDSVAALKYLQVDLSQTVNHQDALESVEFRNLTSSLFDKAGNILIIEVICCSKNRRCFSNANETL